jgi:UDP-N-acetylmuramoylalanine--D-glutamate ligase
MDLAGRKVLVLGLGETGLSMARWAARRGGAVRVAERAAPPALAALRAASTGTVTTGPFVLAPRRRRSGRGSPGCPPAGRGDGAAQAGRRRRRRFCALCRERRRPGDRDHRHQRKSTVTALASAMCAAGVDCEVAGNISPAVLTPWLAAGSTAARSVDFGCRLS